MNIRRLLIIIFCWPSALTAQENQIDSLVIKVDKFEKRYVIPPTMESFRNTENLVSIHTAFHSEHLNFTQWVRLEPREGESKFDGRVLVDCYANDELQFSLFFKPNGTYITSFDDHVYAKNTGFLMDLHQIIYNFCDFE